MIDNLKNAENCQTIMIFGSLVIYGLSRHYSQTDIRYSNTYLISIFHYLEYRKYAKIMRAALKMNNSLAKVLVQILTIKLQQDETFILL